MSLKVIIYLMTARVSLLSAAGNKGGQTIINCTDTPVNQMAYVGDSVTINCSYPIEDKSKVKYFCREDKTLKCNNVISTQSSNYTRLERFSMMDHKDVGLYKVVIFKLTKDDAGRYQCALKPATDLVECLTEIHLHVLRQDDIIPTNLTCITGETAAVRCPYPDSHQNYIKYLCKGDNLSKCVELIRTKEVERDVSVGRFSIRDNKRTNYFYVNILNVDTTDSGTYWCGFDSGRSKWLSGRSTKIHPCVDLTVNESRPPQGIIETEPTGGCWAARAAAAASDDKRHDKTKKSSFSTHPTAGAPSSTNFNVGHSNSGVIGGVAACLVTILTAVIVLILCRHKLTRTQGGSPERSINNGQNTQEDHEGHDYEEIQEGIQLADQLHYASVTLQTATGSTDRSALPGTAENGSLACVYSSVKHGGSPPPLYATLTKHEEL